MKAEETYAILLLTALLLPLGTEAQVWQKKQTLLAAIEISSSLKNFMKMNCCVIKDS